MTSLLDVKLLIALVDASHVSHDAAHAWFARRGRRKWATCPITENGLVRIVASPKYPNALATPADALALLDRLVRLPSHVFWPDGISLRDTALINPARILTVGQTTDSYLLALATAKGGKLATLDRRLSALAVNEGARSLCLVGA